MKNIGLTNSRWHEQRSPAPYVRFPEGHLKAFLGEPEADLILAALTLQRLANELIRTVQVGGPNG